MCRDGYAACNDKSDLKECSEDLQCIETPGHTKPSLQSPHDHRECQYKQSESDRVYDNIGRGDEKHLTSLVQSSHVNYTELEQCNRENGKPGVMCGEKCIEKHIWCREERIYSCSTNTSQFTTQDNSITVPVVRSWLMGNDVLRHDSALAARP